MPTKFIQIVWLTEPLRDFLDEKVASDDLQTGSEVVRAALRRLQDNLQDSVKCPRDDPADGADGIGFGRERYGPRTAKPLQIEP